ncbi:MAG: hypothetical protein J0I41_10805 [Filimonas sp.]|nr:hypothetical protein [Filimonas sp.]
MKKLMLASAILLYSTQMQAQSATTTRLEYQKKMFEGATINVTVEKSITEDAIDAIMAKKGSKGKNTSGYRLYKNVPLSTEMMDVYIDVNQKSKREATTSSIYMITSKLNDPLTNKSESDTAGVAASVAFLNSLAGDILVYKADVDVQKQEDVVKKTGKKLEALQSDKNTYEKRLSSTKTKLQKNNEDIKTQQDAVLKLSDTAVIRNSADALQKQRKKLTSLQEDSDDYAKKITDLESKLKTTNNDISTTQNDLQGQRDTLQKLQDVKKKLMTK